MDVAETVLVYVRSLVHESIRTSICGAKKDINNPLLKINLSRLVNPIFKLINQPR